MDRIGYVGASDVAPILGESNFSSQVDVWKVKTGRKPSFEGNEATEWGTRLEKDVAKKFEDNHPEFEIIDFEDQQFWHTGFDILKTRPDRGVKKGDKMRLLEIKTALGNYTDHWKDGLPVSVWWQCQAQMLSVSDNVKFEADFMYVAVLKTGPNYEEYTVKADPESWYKIQKEVSKFWRLVETETPPAFSIIDNIADDHQPTEEILTEDDHLDRLFLDLEKHSMISFMAENLIKKIKNEIESIVLEKKADGYRHNGYSHKFVHVKPSVKKTLDQKKVKEYLTEKLGKGSFEYYKDKAGFSYSKYSLPALTKAKNDKSAK